MLLVPCGLTTLAVISQHKPFASKLLLQFALLVLALSVVQISVKSLLEIFKIEVSVVNLAYSHNLKELRADTKKIK